ncbi:MAG: terminase small subunit [Blastococcus sp.]
MGDVVDATERAIKAAGHLTSMDAGAVQTLRLLAVKVDALEGGDLNADGKFDNVSIPTYLRYCEALGLTPAGRVKLGPVKEAVGGKLGQLRSVQGGKSSSAG